MIVQQWWRGLLSRLSGRLFIANQIVLWSSYPASEATHDPRHSCPGWPPHPAPARSAPSPSSTRVWTRIRWRDSAWSSSTTRTCSCGRWRCSGRRTLSTRGDTSRWILISALSSSAPCSFLQCRELLESAVGVLPFTSGIYFWSLSSQSLVKFIWMQPMSIVQ